MLSFVQTLRRWYSTVRGLTKSRVPIWIGETLARQACDLRFAVRELAGRLHRAFAGPLARGQELATRAVREGLDAHGGEHVVGAPLLLACVEASALAAQPLPVDEAARANWTRMGVRPSREIASVYSRSASSPSLTSAQLLASMPSAQSPA
jgi:hypothetical protein